VKGDDHEYQAKAGAAMSDLNKEYLVTSPPQQERSRQTLRRILAAAEQLFTDVGFHGATVPEICRLAQSSAGAFYKRFRDKDELLAVLFADLIAEIRTRIGAALSPEALAQQDLPSLAESIVGELADVLRTRSGLLRVLAVVCETRPEFMELSSQMYTELTGRLQAVLAGRRTEFNHPDPLVAGDFAAGMATAVLRQRALSPGSGDAAHSADWALLEHELTRSVLGYLGANATGRP
jgi:AcrR family transcriptional regulator